MIKQILAISAIALGLAHPISSYAQAGMDHSKMSMDSSASMMTDGEVKKVDQEAGKVTIKHGDIKHMDMPGMTMVFTAKDKSILANVKAGDKVKFVVINEGGKMFVTEIHSAK